MVTVVSVDAKLTDDLEGILTPVLDIDQGVVERRTVVACQTIYLAERAGSSEDIGRDDFVNKTPKLSVRQADAVERLKLLAEISLERGAVPDVRAILVL